MAYMNYSCFILGVFFGSLLCIHTNQRTCVWIYLLMFFYFVYFAIVFIHIQISFPLPARAVVHAIDSLSLVTFLSVSLNNKNLVFISVRA